MGTDQQSHTGQETRRGDGNDYETKAHGESSPVDPDGERTLVSRIEETVDSVRLSLSGFFDRGTGKTIEDYVEAGDLEPDPFRPPPLSEELRTHPTRESVLEDVRQYFATSELPFEDRPDETAIDERFFDFSYLADHEEVERYWVNEPYAYVTIVRDRQEQELRYRVVEPYLSTFEEYVFEEMTKILRNNLMYHDLGEAEDRKANFTRLAGDLIHEHTAAVTTLTLYKFLYYLRRDFVDYDRIDPIMHDERIEDISCDGVDVPVFVYHSEYRDLDTNVSFGNKELISFVARMAQRSGKHLSVSNPLVDASLPSGSRIQLSFGGDIATRGANFTIRQFSAAPDTPIDLINWDTFSIEEVAYLWLAIENNRSLLFAGGTGSGKTTSLNAVSFFVPKKSKIVSIEDTPEIKLPHDNWIQSLTRDSVSSSSQGEVTMYQQLQSALRQRPEYILVGEIRTESRVALTFFQAMATGHSAYTTMHSESVIGVINRLENEPLSVPTEMIKELDIISIQRQVQIEGQRVRRNDNITELLSGQDGDIHVNEVFEWNSEDDSYNSLRDSDVFDDIAADRGWSRTRIRREYKNRQEVLRYMVENDITWYEDVARTIHTFMQFPDVVLEQMRADEYDPSKARFAGAHGSVEPAAPLPANDRSEGNDAVSDPDGEFADENLTDLLGVDGEE